MARAAAATTCGPADSVAFPSGRATNASAIVLEPNPRALAHLTRSIALVDAYQRTAPFRRLCAARRAWRLPVGFCEPVRGRVAVLPVAAGAAASHARMQTSTDNLGDTELAEHDGQRRR